MQDIEESLSIRGRRSEKEQNVKAKKNAREGGEKKKMNWWKYGKQGNEEGKLNSLHALILFVTKFGSIFKHGCSLRVLLWYINVHIFPSHFMTFLSDLSAWQLKSAHSTAFSQPCLLFVLLAGYSIIRCKNHHSLGYLMMFVSVHLGESGRSLL